MQPQSPRKSSSKPPERTPRRGWPLTPSRRGNSEENGSTGRFVRVVDSGLIAFFGLTLFAVWALGSTSGGGSEAAGVAISPGANLGWLFLSAFVALVGLNGLFVAIETAVELLRQIHVKHVKDLGGENTATNLQKMIDRRASYVAATTFGSQACRFLIFVLALELAPYLAGIVFKGLDAWYGLILATVVIAIPLLLVNAIVELVPRSYAALHPHRVALRFFKFLKFASVLFAAPTSLVLWLAGLLTARFGGKASFTMANQAEEEIKVIVETAQESGEIEVEEKELLHSVFEFTDTVVREVMTPRVDIDAMPSNSDPAEVILLIQQSGHSRIPIFEDTDDAIVGIVHAKDLLMAMLGDKKVNLRDLMREPIFVPENKNLHDLLKDMRQRRSQMAVVQDEFGGTSGIVTIEDIVEELVGDIVDEYDTEEPEIVMIDEGAIVEGKTHVDDVNHALGSEFESEEFDTIGGYVFGLFGRQPAQDESIEDMGYLFTVAETDGRRIGKLRIEKALLVEAEPSQADLR